jgi:hypothetical protein
MCVLMQSPNPKRQLCDPDIRSVLLRHIEETFPDKEHDLILEEFGCKTARIDVAVVNGALHAFEIKSDCDSLDRLEGQIEQYSRIFDFVTIVCGKKLFSAAKELVPRWWGLRFAERSNGDVRITEVRQPKPNPSRDKSALVRMLWKDEALRCLRKNGIKGVTSRHPAEEVWSHAAQKLTLKTIANEVRIAIKARGGSGFAKQLIPNDDSCTTESNTLLDYYSENLAWLLSQPIPHRLD